MKLRPEVKKINKLRWIKCKIKKKEFKKAVSKDFKSVSDFARNMDSSYISIKGFYCSTSKVGCSLRFASRVLRAFRGQYKRGDLFIVYFHPAVKLSIVH